MAYYDDLKAAIRAAIYPNSDKEVTASMVQGVLLDIVDTFGRGYQVLGVASASVSPNAFDDKCVYIASAGSYPNFGLTVAEGDVALFYNVGNDWRKDEFTVVLDGIVTERKIAAAAVTEGRIADGAVTEQKISGGAVTNEKLAGEVVETGNIYPNAVTEGKIKDASVTEAKIADSAVTTAKVAEAAVTTDKIADGSVTEPKLAERCVTTDKILEGSVNASKIAEDSVVLSKLSQGVRERIYDTYTKDETMTKDEVYGLVTTPKQYYVSVEADALTVDATTLLPAAGQKDTIYRVGKWDGTQYATNYYCEYAWDGEQYVLLSVKQPGIDDEPTVASSNLVKSGGITTMYGAYHESDEWLRLITDGAGHILFGIKADGSVEWSRGVPTPVTAYVQARVNEIRQGAGGTAIDGLDDVVAFLTGFATSDTLADILEGKVDVVEGLSMIDAEYAAGVSYEEDDDYLSMTTDANHVFIEGTKKDGTKVFGGDLDIHLVTMGRMESSDYLSILLDGNNKIIAGVKKDGDIVFGIGVPSDIKAALDGLSDRIDANTEAIANMSVGRGTFIKVVKNGTNYYVRTRLSSDKDVAVWMYEHPTGKGMTYNSVYVGDRTLTDGELIT